MAVGKVLINVLKRYNTRQDKKRRKSKPVSNRFIKREDIAYMNDDNYFHKFDIIYANDENKKNICVIDIHGGSYVFGDRKNNHFFGEFFNEVGFDFISLDYVVNDGKRGFEHMLSDCVVALKYIVSNKEKLGLENDKLVLTGDSAGGHLVLMLTLLHDSELVRNKLGLDLGELKLYSTLANCPVYDFSDTIDSELLNNSGRKRMFGPNAMDMDYRAKYSPKTYFKEFKTPLFLSTCTNDFLRENAIALVNDLESAGNHNYEFIDYESSDKAVAHVHNVLFPERDDGKFVNDKMIEFILKNTK